ncbi:MAG: hypothetical protein J6D54_01645 [Olsenella sp.]|nr:hypothetical protein [Olsenella sp.]
MADMRGLDISSWQEGMDVAEWANALGLAFIIIKVGGNEGGRYADRCFDGFYRQAKACGLHVGAYYYTTSCDCDAAFADAEHCLSLLDGYDLDMPVYMDVEDGRQFSLSARELTDVIKTFCDRVNAAGRYAGLYTGGSAWLGNMYPDELTCYANWIAWWADWGSVENLRGKCGDIGMWQVGGISLDGHIAYGDVAGHQDYDLTDIAYWERIDGGSDTIAPVPSQGDGPSPQQRVLDLIRGEVGYVPSNGKHNKYAQYLDSLGDVYNYPKDGYDWCDIFADYPFYYLFGKDAAVRMLNQPLGGCGAGCSFSADYFAEVGRFDDKPEVAAPIYFGDRGNEYHVGMVEGYDDDCVYTIEGNTGYSEGYAGGAVMRRTYSRDDYRISGYGHPDWSVVGGSSEPSGGSHTPAPRNNRDGGELDVDGIGGYNTVVDMQHALGTVEDGTISGQYGVNREYLWGFDAVDLNGGGSQMVQALQARIGASVDGIWGFETSVKLQEYLIAKGYSCGDSGVDGYFGRDSVRALQRCLNEGRF